MTTLDIRPDLTADEARALTSRIRERVADLLPLIREAFERRAWISLGHESWDAYCDAELTGLRLPVGQRRAAVVELRSSGMSNRTIGAALGVDEKTVRNDLAGAENSAPREVTGADGKRYAAARPAERVSATVDAPTDSPAGRDQETAPVVPVAPTTGQPGPALVDMLREEIAAATERAQQQREEILSDHERYRDNLANIPPSRVAQAIAESQPAVECGRIAFACREFVHGLRGLDLTAAARGALKPDDASALRQATDLIDRINQTMGVLA